MCVLTGGNNGSAGNFDMPDQISDSAMASRPPALSGNAKYQFTYVEVLTAEGSADLSPPLRAITGYVIITELPKLYHFSKFRNGIELHYFING